MKSNEFDRIDERLDIPGQTAARKLVQALPEDSLSLAWRSNLNEKLRESAAKSRRRRLFSITLAPAFGLAVTASLVMVMLVNQPEQQPRRDSAQLEAALVSTHRQMDMLTDVTGAGLTPTEALRTTSQPVSDPVFDEVDIESL